MFQGGADRDNVLWDLGSTSRSILPVAQSLACHDLGHKPGMVRGHSVVVPRNLGLLW